MHSVILIHNNDRHWTVVRMVEVQAMPLTHGDATSIDIETFLFVSPTYKMLTACSIHLNNIQHCIL
jgi:hypothetical protein